MKWLQKLCTDYRIVVGSYESSTPPSDTHPGGDGIVFAVLALEVLHVQTLLPVGHVVVFVVIPGDIHDGHERECPSSDALSS